MWHIRKAHEVKLFTLKFKISPHEQEIWLSVTISIIDWKLRRGKNHLNKAYEVPLARSDNLKLTMSPEVIWYKRIPHCL